MARNPKCSVCSQTTMVPHCAERKWGCGWLRCVDSTCAAVYYPKRNRWIAGRALPGGD